MNAAQEFTAPPCAYNRTIRRRGRPGRPHAFFDGVEHKFCPMCETWKVLGEFGRAPRSINPFDGLKHECRQCRRESGRRTRQKQRERGHVSKNVIAPGQRYVRIAFLRNGTRKQVRLYRIWDSMKSRCFNPNQKSYYRYGGRGIAICAEWLDYDVFRAWAVANGFNKHVTLDRIDVNGNYEPANCRWLSPKEQQWNSRVAIPLTHDGITKPLAEWAYLHGVNPEVYRQRRRSGWTDSEILTTPLGECRPGRLRGRAAAKAKRLALLSSGEPRT